MAPLKRPLTVRVDRKVFPAVGGRPENLVLKNVEFQVEPGSFVVITGPSGGGKSTLLNIISGLDKEYEGAIDFGGNNDRLAFVFQTPRLLPWRTVYENVALTLPPGDPRLANIPEMLKRVGLTDAANAYPEMISLGMQRRVALARAFVLEPELLLMDEPFVSLDDPTAQGLRELLVELWSRRPTTVLFVTHDRPEAVMLGTRILRLSNGAATIAQDVPVRLSVVDRTDREKVRAEQRRIFGEA
ncbi:MAG: ABC transporter ATP-binding protein [Hyphomicrobium sp.]|uniref:ABC transporter ATP-binding protein n=1 Tax=Hyphomicrobium sp. TaxID=82 RepID=UPI00132C686C|nr:ABC transporter ATP-binding protein [Hyphomicrobium sp.]KAB2940492.1 MAG: ABC transporter ATP-binding protein [Hyphomicrobium sp.]MBZ0210849.1 ABC transporter ATP-binding protein [Hyphomicrobium sp.]